MSDSVTLHVRVIPNAKRTLCEGCVDGVYRLRLRAQPEDGKANKELIEFLAKRLGVRRAQITFLAGEKSRQKVLRIEGLEGSALARLGEQDS